MKRSTSSSPRAGSPSPRLAEAGISFREIAGLEAEANPGNAWALFEAYLEALARFAENEVLQKWTGVLGGADVYTFENCYQMIWSERVDRGILGPLGVAGAWIGAAKLIPSILADFWNLFRSNSPCLICPFPTWQRSQHSQHSLKEKSYLDRRPSHGDFHAAACICATPPGSEPGQLVRYKNPPSSSTDFARPETLEFIVLTEDLPI
jgi:hypothetical protein